jgi:DNA-binding response OmpR family regulator
MVANHRYPPLNNCAISLSTQSPRYRQPPLSLTGEETRFTVLLVDPDLPLRTLLGEHLTNLNYYVLIAEGYEETLHLLSSKTITLVLLNIRTPASDGIGICMAIRQRSEVPILSFTALDRLDDAANALARGADGYITRPFTLTTLKIRLRGLLNHGF